MKRLTCFFLLVLLVPNIYALTSLSGAAATIPGIGKYLARFVNIIDAGLYMSAVGAGFAVVVSLLFKKDENILTNALKWLIITGLISAARAALPTFFGLNI